MVLSVFIDLKKAFDSVPHQLILAKLSRLGVGGIELQWFSSYLTDRSQFTNINSDHSPTTRVTIGVPPGGATWSFTVSDPHQ